MKEQIESKAVKPKYKVCKQNGKLRLAIALPGVNRKDISIKTENGKRGIVNVFAQRENPSHEKWSLVAGTPEPEAYALKLQIGYEYDLEKTEAKFEKNVLLLLVPVHEVKQIFLELQ
jgi:HSP20 family molecular chaperone IbpA